MIRTEPQSFHSRLTWGLLVLLPLFALLLSLASGRLSVPLLEVCKALLQPWLPALTPEPESQVLVRIIRLPRTLLALLCGAGLAVAGAALQGTLRNPLVSPQTIGVLSGAGFGGTLALLLALGKGGMLLLAFASGMGAMLLVLLLGNKGNRPSLLLLVLAGVIMSTVFAAGTTLLQYYADPERELPSLVYWLMGSFTIASAHDLQWASLPILLATSALLLRSHWINILASGDDEAHALGANVERERLFILICVAIICAAVVAVAGIIAWVGLLVPHLARLLVGADHRRLLPASALLGGTYLLLMDFLCRTMSTTELPLSALTALIGAPVFIHLLRRSHDSGWLTD